MQKDEMDTGDAGAPFGDVLVETLKGIRSEILLYGIAVIVILIAGSATFGTALLQALEIPLLVFATLVLIVYFLNALMIARKRAARQKEEKRRA